jgi:F-type H+-transporting ATPase subunit b
MIELNGTSIVLAISFVIFVILLNFLFYKPMKKVMEERAKYIQDNKNDAENNNSKTQKLIEEKDTKIAEAKKKSFDFINETNLNVKEKLDIAISGAKAEFKQKTDKQVDDLKREKEEVLNSMKGEIAQISSEISSKVLGKKTTIANVSDEIIEKALKGEL